MSGEPPSAFDWRRAALQHRDRLPHVRQENALYFVTFRLNDSLPQERVVALREARDRWIARNPPPHSHDQEREYRSIWTARIENLMDAGYGRCVLRDPVCRGFAEATMRYDDGRKYALGEFVLMPNHVHALVHVFGGTELGDVIKAWKSVSARRIGKHRGEPGSYWMDEYFDHAVRSDDSVAKFVRYIRENPGNLPPTDYTSGCGSLGL